MHEEDEKKPNDEETDEEHDDEQNREQLEKDKAQLEELLKALDAAEKQKRTKRRKGIYIAFDLGGFMHPFLPLNFLAFYMLNLTLIYSVAELFRFGSFDTLSAVLLFVLVYTALEMLFRYYMVFKHVKIVLRTMGFIFYFGYLTLFYLIDVYVFPHSVRFMNETLLIVFVGMFIVFRAIAMQLIRQFFIWRARGQ